VPCGAGLRSFWCSSMRKPGSGARLILRSPAPENWATKAKGLPIDECAEDRDLRRLICENIWGPA